MEKIEAIVEENKSRLEKSEKWEYEREVKELRK